MTRLPTMVHLARRRFDVVNSRQTVLIVIPPICLVIATGVVIVRWRTRHKKRINTLMEDLLCMFALVFSGIIVALLFGMVLLEGQGLTIADVEGASKLVNWSRGQFAVDICWGVAVSTVHLSLVVFYGRLYRHIRPTLSNVCYLVGSFRAIWLIYSIAAWVYYCHPPGQCRIIGKTNCLVIGILHVVILALTICTSVPALLDLDLSLNRKKLAVLGWSVLVLFCFFCALMRMDCAFSFFGNWQTDPVATSTSRMLFSPLEVAAEIIVTTISAASSFHTYQNDRRQLSKESGMHGLRRLKLRSGSSSSSTSNLNPANWVGKNTGRNDAFVSLADGSGSNERVKDLGHDDIKVVKEVTVEHRT